MKKVRCVVIGAGWWTCEVHLPALLKHPKAELVSVQAIYPMYTPANNLVDSVLGDEPNGRRLRWACQSAKTYTNIENPS